MNQQEGNQTKGIPSGVLRTDMRREDPLLGFKESNKGSNGSGGFPNPPLQLQDSDKDIILNHPSYRQAKQKEDRNALSQDCGSEIKQMDIKNNFGNRKGSANPNFLDFTLPNDHMNRNIKQKVQIF